MKFEYGPRIDFRLSSLAFALAFVAIGGFTTAASASLGPATNFNIGGGAPLQVVVADMNGDDKQDLVTADSGSNEVSVLLGDGTGSFTSPSFDITVGPNPRSLAAGDLNNDDKADVVTANYGDNTVSVLLGLGNGKFEPPASLATGSHPSAIAIGKLDANGTLDLAVTNHSIASVSTFSGNGSGSFGGAVNHPVETYPDAVGIGKFNADARPDLAVANSGGDSISVLLGLGDASFGPAVRYPTSSVTGSGLGPNSLAIAELTGDDKLDLATANTYSDDISVLAGGLNGTFGSAKNFAAGDQAAGIAAGDLTDDPFADIAVVVPGANLAPVLPGNGAGSFGVAADLTTGGTPKSATVGDFNGDSNPDLAVANSMSDSISVFLSRSPVGFVAPASLAFPAQVVGTPSAVKPVTITNTGVDPLKVTGAEVTGISGGSFSVSGNDCPAVGLPTGGSCGVSVQFAPQGAGPVGAPLSLSYNGPSSPLVVPLSGTGTSTPAVKPKISCKVKKKRRRGKVRAVRVTCEVTPASASAGKRYAWRLKKRGKVVRKGKVEASEGNVTFKIPRIDKLNKGKYYVTVKGGSVQRTSSFTL